ncbi:MAG: cell division protein SepF [Candidatus Pacearchaeota archaeon]|nr:cell division protein SepF [Candidatus Pacearchaeota archaeon]
MVFDKLKKALKGQLRDEGSAEDYLEIDLEKGEKQTKVLVKLFVLKKYEDVNDILNVLRDGYSIAIIDMKILKQKDPIELKRAAAKIKKTTDALEGSIAGFGENLLIVTPSFAQIQKDNPSQPSEPSKHKFD